MSRPTNVVEITAIDTRSVPWEMIDIPQVGGEMGQKRLFQDEETGMTSLLVKYPAGFNNIWHTHPCAHVMFVLDGVLKTHQGEYGPGSFVWFPEGGWMEHGATADQDVTVLFISNKELSIVYAAEEGHPYPMH